jgi:hypothetical protein
MCLGVTGSVTNSVISTACNSVISTTCLSSEASPPLYKYSALFS